MPFDGFISYSHAADGRLAPAVQRGLHRLAKPWHRRRALWIFRDQTGLAVTPKLWTSIQEALDGSRHFVLLASPEAAGSPWVNREIEHWLATKSADRILPVVTDGEWQWDPAARDFTAGSTAVPAALRGVFGEEPLYLDLRWARDDLHLSLQHVRFRDAIAQLAAPMHGVSKDELEGEDVRQHRRARRLSAVAAAALVLLTLVASLTGVVAVRNADRAEAAAVEARMQQQEASQQRSTAEAATEESQRQQQNARVQEEHARVQETRAETASAETRRQQRLAAVQRALAEDAAAEAEREQAAAQRYRDNAAREQANAERQKRAADDAAAEAARQKENAERQQEAAEDAAAEAARQKANAERQTAVARRQQELANQAEARAAEQQRLAEHHRELARQADQERKRQEQLAREAADDAREQREAAALQQRITVSRRLMGRARSMLVDDPKKALMLGVAAQRLHPDRKTRDQLSHLAMATNYGGTLADVGTVAGLAGRVVAVAGAAGTVSLWDTTDPAAPVRLAQLPVEGTPAAGADGRTLAVFAGSQAVLWDVTDPAAPVRTSTLTDAAGIVAVTVSPDGRLVATSARDTTTRLWTAGGEPLATLPGAASLSFGPGGRTAVTGGRTVAVWNLADPASPAPLTTIDRGVFERPNEPVIAYNPRRPVLAVRWSVWDSHVWMWDMTDPGRPEATQMAGHGGAALSTVAFSPDGSRLALGDVQGTAGVWQVQADTWQSVGTAFGTFATPGEPVRSLALTGDGRGLITTGDRRTATLWNVQGRFARDPVATMAGPFPGNLVRLAFGPDSRTLLGAGREGTAVPWDLTDPAHPRRGPLRPLHSGPAEGAALSRDGRTLAVTGADRAVTLLDMTPPGDPAPLYTIREDGAKVRDVAFSPDGRTLAVGRDDGRSTLWDLTDRRKPAPAGVLTGARYVSALAFAPDGRTLAVAQGFGVSLWDVTDRAQPARLASVALEGAVSSTGSALDFSPDSRTLAVATQSSEIAALIDVADPAHPQRTATLAGHSDFLRSVAFSPDGRTLATASMDNALMLWDVSDQATPIRYALVKTVDLESWTTAFSPDGRTLAAGGTFAGISNVTLWDAGVPAALAADPARHACTVAGRGLDAGEWRRYIPELSHQATC